MSCFQKTTKGGRGNKQRTRRPQLQPVSRTTLMKMIIMKRFTETNRKHVTSPTLLLSPAGQTTASLPFPPQPPPYTHMGWVIAGFRTDSASNDTNSKLLIIHYSAITVRPPPLLPVCGPEWRQQQTGRRESSIKGYLPVLKVNCPAAGRASVQCGPCVQHVTCS